MKPKGLLIAVALLAVLGGVTWWSNKQEAAKAKSGGDAANKVLTIPTEQFQEIRINDPVAGTHVVVRRENDKWNITEPSPLPADLEPIGAIMSALSDLNADQVIDEKAANLAPYGLDKPTVDVQVVRKDGKTDELLIGDLTPTGSGNYVKLAKDARVFTVNPSLRTTVDKGPNDLRDKRLLTFDSNKLTRVVLEAKGEPIEFGKNALGDWQILKPRTLRADGAKVEDLVGRLKGAQMDLSGSEDELKKIPAQFAAASKVVIAKAIDSGGEQTLEVRKDKDGNYYAKSTAVAGVYKVAPELATNLDKTLDDLRTKKLFDFGYNDVSRVEIKNGSTSAVAYDQSGDKWTSGPNSIDFASAQTLVDKLRDLAATAFAASGGGEPVFEATVTSNSGKRVEKVSITKQGGQYFAKRGDEPSIYELDGKSVDDLRNAATGVKAAAPEQPKKK